MVKPLTSRPRDLVYFIFFVMHIFASLCVDFQPLYPPALVPSGLRQLAEWYLTTSNDPLLKSAFGLSDDPRIWFKSFLFLEVFFQFPTFFIAARGLWNDSQKTYLLILVYAASTATTVWACVATIIATPGLAADELGMLLSSYIPFCVIPLIMTVDMAFRLHRMVADALSAQEASKSK
ncbi:transmembrane protein 6/97 [Roridomyces roridus]|uniref:Efficient mitochondria targeting-associated protein 19 n=1 Tax=Roridomyces roridus TaxID=1738132 RepID=A0AAD7BMR5_9AGAR|nr:transmembrane protein 6/97 [Roridomyces roridus]